MVEMNMGRTSSYKDSSDDMRGSVHDSSGSAKGQTIKIRIIIVKERKVMANL